MKTNFLKSFIVINVLVFLFNAVTNAQGIIITSGTNLVTNGSVHLVINNGGFTNNGIFAEGSGTVSFTGNTVTANSFISGSGTNAFNNLALNKTGNGIQLNRNISIANSLLFTSGDSLFLNNYTIELGNNGSLSGETNSKRITGLTGGYVQVTQTLNAPTVANPGNLGAEITSSANLGSTVIRRGHQQQSGASVYRYFDITPANNSGLDATLKFYYLHAELAGVSEGNLGMFSSSNGGINWMNLGENGLDPALNYVTKNGIDQFARFTLSNISQPLAVKLLYLKARFVNQQIILSWATANETDNNRFEIERSADERNFIRLTSIPGAGNSSSDHYYDYTDNNPLIGKNFYRLRQVDNDARFTYSYIVMVNTGTKENGFVNIYPNPAGSTIKLSFIIERNDDYLVQVSDMNGKVIKSKIVHCIAGLNEMEYNVSSLSSGIYTIRIAGSSLKSIQLMKK